MTHQLGRITQLTTAKSPDFKSYLATPAVRTESSLYPPASPERDLLQRMCQAMDKGDSDLLEALHEEASAFLQIGGGA